MASDATEAAAWYIEHMGCQAYEREAACRYAVSYTHLTLPTKA